MSGHRRQPHQDRHADLIQEAEAHRLARWVRQARREGAGDTGDPVPEDPGHYAPAA
ncbi:hypothetical protein [Streptomyces clavuligerus]|nr:hypothetical protein [Streptomyces clavuligerus]MBY6302387.1 hypothetical protein [Streptomyces clavuligerus]QPJ95356.1 hypothetical protein GE265_21500 [Streptomyces clavuligerus]QPL62584.1 hypothetical protein I3J04_06785 [Streptomyces clavuligerus]QPL68616.1 hypothetical protein I3J05_06800 [Streptomyces clavuligerus]QPL74695.1 hypothetical protein I3J06_06800 [Streptomyces clavuligerus]